MLPESVAGNPPRSIVTDQQNLKAQGRPNLATGISLYVSDDRKVATWSLLGWEYVHGKQPG